jgi:hypothetical protein
MVRSDVQKRIRGAVVLAGLFVHGALAFAANSPPSVDLRLSLYGKGVDETYNRGERFGTELEATLRHNFLPSLDLLGRIRFTAELGSAQAAFTQEYAPRQTIELREARLRWQPLPFLDFKAGAIDQDDWGAKILLDGQAFPGVREVVRVPVGDFYVEVGAEQAIANTPMVTFGSPVPRPGYPYFFMERAEVGFQRGDIAAEVHVGHFAFDRLPAGAAYNSRFLGNSVVGDSQQTAAFVHDFSGFLGGFSAKARATSWLQPKVVFAALVNQGAPWARGTSYLASLENRIEFNDTFILAPQFLIFSMGEDASPALYTSGDWGHNNHRGFGAGINAELPAEHLEFGAAAVQAPVITPSRFQSDWLYFTVFFRSHYDVL